MTEQRCIAMIRHPLRLAKPAFLQEPQAPLLPFEAGKAGARPLTSSRSLKLAQRALLQGPLAPILSLEAGKAGALEQA